MLMKYSPSQEFPCNTSKQYAICIIALCSSHSFSLKGNGERTILEREYSEENWQNLLVTYISDQKLDYGHSAPKIHWACFPDFCWMSLGSFPSHSHPGPQGPPVSWIHYSFESHYSLQLGGVRIPDIVMCCLLKTGGLISPTDRNVGCWGLKLSTSRGLPLAKEVSFPKLLFSSESVDNQWLVNTELQGVISLLQ